MIKKNLPQFQSLTGMTRETFEEFLFHFEQDWHEHITNYRLDGKPRKRLARGAVCVHLPATADKLLFILSYLKNNPLQEYHAASYGMTQSQVNPLIQLFTDILIKTLKRLNELPEENTLRLIHTLKFYSDILLDGTERPIERSQDEELQRECYSGKKKHCLKNNLISSLDKRILWLSKTYYGSVHDKKICYLQPLKLPLGIFIYQDTGFTGHNPEGATVLMPTKKPKGRELTKEQKQQNKEISSVRIGVEHAIGGVKKYRIVKETFKCRKFDFQHKVMLIACGLHNFTISLKTNAIAI